MRRRTTRLTAGAVAAIALLATGTGAAEAAPHAAAGAAAPATTGCWQDNGSDHWMYINGGDYWSSPYYQDPTGCYGNHQLVGSGVKTWALAYCWTYGDWFNMDSHGNGEPSRVRYRLDGANSVNPGTWVTAAQVTTDPPVDPVPGLRRCGP